MSAGSNEIKSINYIVQCNKEKADRKKINAFWFSYNLIEILEKSGPGEERILVKKLIKKF